MTAASASPPGKQHQVSRAQPAATAQDGRNHEILTRRQGVRVRQSPPRHPSAQMTARSDTRPEASIFPMP